MFISRPLLCTLVLLVTSNHLANALTEEIEATPTNTNGFEIGELSVAQWMLMVLVFLKLVLLYASGILPLEVDLGEYMPRDEYDYYSEYPIERRSHARALHNATQTTKKASSLRPLLFDCPLQFVCDVDHWANEMSHENIVENYLASWFMNSKPSPFSTTSKGKDFMGVPDSCAERYPCPINIQKTMGVTIPGSGPQANEIDVDYPITDGGIYL